LTEKLIIQHALATDVGLVRESNEDYVDHVERDGEHLFILADGMGGLPGGEVASSVASEAARDHFLLRTRVAPEELLEEAVMAAHRACQEVQIQRPSLSRMGTTLELALVRGAQMWWGHVGDSRQYLVTDGGRRVPQLTVDHTLVQGLVEQGILSAEDARHHPHRNLLSSAVGTGDRPQLDIATEPLTLGAGDCLVQCSDGLSDLVLAPEIGAILNGIDPSEEPITLETAQRSRQKAAPESPEDLIELGQACEALIDLAKRRGGHDNITVQLVRWIVPS
jgi:protein phosphatase